MAQFVRPPIAVRAYQDDDGTVINYGHRWERKSPPDESYSVTSNLDRYEPLHEVARALIDYLESTYEVTLENDASCIADFLRPQGVLEAVRVSPRDPTCATLTFGFSSYPGVFLHVGVLHDFAFPTCGCDACDEGIDDLLDHLEATVFAVIGGNYRESVISRRRRLTTYELNRTDGSESWRGRLDAVSKDQIKPASRLLAIVPDGWAAWPLRPSG